MTIDTHVHTWRCRHATGTVFEYIQEARRRGVIFLGFAEHLPLPSDLVAADPYARSYAMPESELALYASEVSAAKEEAGRHGLVVLLGVEADLHPGNEDHVRRLLASVEVDFVLGSVHYLDGWAFDDPDRVDGYDRWSAEDLWERYFDDLAHAARSGLADAIAHPDLIKKFGCRPKVPPDALYELFAEAVADAGVAVEISTAGLRKPCAELYPSQDLLRALRARKVPVTIGSDAHSPSEVAYAYDAAAAAARGAGYRSAVVFRNRLAEEVPL
ncbi:MAG: histidinol-phosphatase HisJ family protein [Coriobacteriia bacterium]|nr:histidinol-phosphatase HisJ family protein [Coriobacteriia bacterium]